MMGGGMHGFWGLGWPGMILGWVINLGLIIGVVLLVVWIVRRTALSTHDGPRPYGGPERGPSPREILQTRYARGEIDRDQYHEILAELDG